MLLKCTVKCVKSFEFDDDGYKVVCDDREIFKVGLLYNVVISFNNGKKEED